LGFVLIFGVGLFMWLDFVICVLLFLVNLLFVAVLVWFAIAVEFWMFVCVYSMILIRLRLCVACLVLG